jgi:hypothetical protein
MNNRSFSVIAGAAAVIAGAVAVLATSFAVAQADSSSSTLFEQPSLDGVAGNFFVPPAVHKPPPSGVFALILWQPNPNRPDGMLVPTAWGAGGKTGFYPSAPVEKHQAGFRDASATTTVQADGDTVGAYINSADLPEGSHEYKMMITPEIIVPPSAQVQPYAQAGRAILVSLELQVPTAVDAHRDGSETYVNADLVFVDHSRGTKISYGCNLFFNGHPHRRAGGHIRLDQDTQNMMINSVVGLDTAWLAAQPGSAVSQSEPWNGWKVFRFAITEKNFAQALDAFDQTNRSAKVSVKPGDYSFVQFHLNAELHFNNAPAELGWSMRHAKIVVEDAAFVRQ